MSDDKEISEDPDQSAEAIRNEFNLLLATLPPKEAKALRRRLNLEMAQDEEGEGVPLRPLTGQLTSKKKLGDLRFRFRFWKG